MKSFSESYKAAGVDITAGYTAVELMKKTVGDRCQVKASGGIHTHEEMMAMIEAGATRIGASAGVKLMAE